MSKMLTGVEIDSKIFDRDYFERGLESGKSCYQNYRWIPELTIPMAMAIIDFLGIGRFTKVLDFGCAKGYLVKALRMLYRDAWGFDISEYAIKNVDPMVTRYCQLPYAKTDGFPPTFRFGVAKDTFEHIPVIVLDEILQNLLMRVTFLFAIIPLGNGTEFRAPANNFDVTHVNCEDEDWWKDRFRQNGWTLKDFRFKVFGIKESYYEKHPTGHGFFVLQSFEDEPKSLVC